MKNTLIRVSIAIMIAALLSLFNSPKTKATGKAMDTAHSLDIK